MLHHTTVEVRRVDAEAETRFWSLVGFERVEPPSALAERATWVERAGTQVHLLYTEEPVVPPEAHVAVVAADFEAAFAALEAAGHGPRRRTAHWGAARAMVRTPAGHLVELMAAPPEAQRP